MGLKSVDTVVGIDRLIVVVGLLVLLAFVRTVAFEIENVRMQSTR